MTDLTIASYLLGVRGGGLLLGSRALLDRVPEDLSTPVENSSFRRSKIPPPRLGDGLHFQPVGVKMEPAGEAEAGSAGEQPAEE